jgi:hypothetical protein
MFQTANIPDDKREMNYNDEPVVLFNLFGSRNDEAFIGSPEADTGFGLFFDEKKEKLSEWLKKEKDKITYIYDFGDDWQHLIELEKILPPEPGIAYPRCVKARHWAPEEDSRGEWLDEEWSFNHPKHQTDAQFNQKIVDEVNKRFRQYELDLGGKRDSLSSGKNHADGREHWRQLFELADQYRRLEPWQWMSDIDLFAVVDPESEVTGYCCVLGEAKETYGLAVYVGDEGFRSLIKIVQHPEDAHPFKQRSLLLSFENRSDLSKEDYRLIKELGLSYRGRKTWPVFRSFVPGYLPWDLEEWEVRFLSTVLEQAISVCQRVKDDPQILHPGEGRLFARVAQCAASGYQWMDGSVLDSVEEDNMVAYCYVSDVELQQIRRSYPLRDRVFECDVSYFPEPVQDKRGERPYFPILYLCLDADSNMIIDYQLCHHDHAAANIQHRFMQLVQTMGLIPKTVHIGNIDTYLMLVPLAAELGIDLVQAELTGLSQAKKEMFRQLGHSV